MPYERGMADLEARIKRGELHGGKLSLMDECFRKLTEVLPLMTMEWHTLIRARMLSADGVLSKILADRGQPIPGNDPHT